jgi:hypothetical protein
MFEKAESIEFMGKVISQMAQDPKIMSYTSRVVIGADYAQNHNIKDIDAREIMSHRQLKKILDDYVLPDNWRFISQYVPGFVKVPYFFIDLMYSKF